MTRITSGLGSLVLLTVTVPVLGQAVATASKRFDFQAGAAFVLDKSDFYNTNLFKGLGLYTTLDFTSHFGAEFDFHQANSSQTPQYERTYEWGGRYHRAYGRFYPYVKAMYGRGVFNFTVPQTGALAANLAYNETVLGAGTDVDVLPWLKFRADYEYQHWYGFPPQGLSPMLFTVGLAYHFPADLRKGRRFR